jgi:elongation factor P
MADTGDIKKDLFMMFNGAICAVVEFQHVNPGKGSAFVRVRLKNVQTGKVVEHTYKSGESIEVVELDRAKMQYLYKDADNYYFMDNASYEQHSIPADLVAEKGFYLKEGQEVAVLMHGQTALSLDLPKKLTFTVTEAMPAVKGDTSGGRVLKEVTIETGMKLGVPIFIEQGEKIVVNTETGEYVERSTEK